MNEIDIEAQLLAYADGDLDADGVAEVEAYLANHADARAYVETQRALRAVVRGKLPDAAAPAYLTRRVLDGIAEADAGAFARFRAWLRTFQLGPTPSLALATVALVAAIFAFVSGADRVGTDTVAQVQQGVAMNVTITGEIQCIDCTTSRGWGVDSECDRYGHRNGIITADGTMWTIKHSTRWSPLLRDTSLWGKTVSIQAHRFGAAHYLDVESVAIADAPVPPGAAPSALAASR